MSFDPNPLSHQLYLKDLETKYLGSDYDHSRPPLRGWRAERQQATLTKTSGLASSSSWVAKLKGFWLGQRVIH